MKKAITLLVASFALCTSVFSQAKEESIIYISSPMPTYPGGEREMLKFISENLKYPNTDTCVQGRVVIRFLIKIDGTIDSINVIRKVHPLFDQEAMRVVKLMPKWIPVKNYPMDTWFTLPITFKPREEKTKKQ